MEEKRIGTKPEKLTYEQLETLANQLNEQNRQLMKNYNRDQTAIQIKRIELCLEIIKLGNLKDSPTFPASFVETCVKEVMDTMTPENDANEEA